MNDANTGLPMSAVVVGQVLDPLVVGPITRKDLALFAGASGDDNPAHIDLDFAREAGLGDVFAHGMLSMAYLGRVLSNWVHPDQIREYRVRFQSITPVNARVTCTAKVEDLFEEDGEHMARILLETQTDQGLVTLMGSAKVALRR